jgi:hypothetical protein
LKQQKRGKNIKSHRPSASTGDNSSLPRLPIRVEKSHKEALMITNDSQKKSYQNSPSPRCIKLKSTNLCSDPLRKNKPTDREMVKMSMPRAQIAMGDIMNSRTNVQWDTSGK